MQDGFRYWAFISYSHHDRGWARWLHKQLETYRVPRRLVGAPHGSGARPRRLYPVFRDRDELPSSADLGGVVQRALQESRYLIVLCSRHAAASRWVNEEVETFKKLGRQERILCLKVDETDDSGSCFVPALLQHYDDEGQPSGQAAEPLAADVGAQADGRDGAVLKLIAGMLGVGYDDLRRRERRRRMQQHLALGTAAIALIVLAVASWRWQQDEKRQALEAQARTVRLNKLYESGREELLAHNEARAAVYLNEVYREGVDTPALRYMLGKAMRVVDAQELRIKLKQAPLSLDINRDGTLAFAMTPDKVLHGLDLRRGGTELFAQALGDLRQWLMGYSPGGGLIWLHHEDSKLHGRWLQLFDARSGALRARVELGPNSSGVSMPPVADDDRHFTFVDADGAVVVGELASAANFVVQRRIAGNYGVARLCRDGRSVLAGRRDGALELRDIVSGALRRRFVGVGGPLTMLASSVGCGVVAGGTINGAVRVWDAVQGTVLVSAGHRRTITDLQFDDDGSRLLSVSRGAAAIWDGRSGALVYASKYFGAGGNVVMLRSDGRQFGQMVEGRLTMFDAASGQESYTLDGHMGSAVNFHYADDAQRLISNGPDGSIVVWSLPDSARAGLGSAPPGKAPAAALSADGHLLFVSEASGGGALWQRAPLRKLRALAIPQRFVSSATFTSDARLLATGSPDGSVVLSEVGSGRTARRFKGVGRATSLQFDADGRFLAAEIEDASLRVWDLRDGSLRLALPSGELQAYAMAPHGALLATGARGRMRLVDLQHGDERWAVHLPSGELELASAAFSRDGRLLLVAGQQGFAFVLDASDGHIVKQLHDPSAAYFWTAAFDPDARQVVLAETSNSIRVWRLADDRLLTLGGHTNAVETAVFSPDGRFALSAGRDGVIKIWDADKGELLDSFLAHDGLIQWRAAVFTPDGADILSTGRDGVAHLWPLRYEARDAAAIAAELECRVAWRVDGSALVPREIDTPRCQKTSEGGGQ
ncbi:TIR domain-containing protein [Solimonas soli]|uniref:WD40 domain-containing protein n=1 Tax=Solimonas soli TaxID=413479 RepID=UPI0004835970|nr:TIR domain-containing protein [Solimonas soli]